MTEYEIPKANIVGHWCVRGNELCSHHKTALMFISYCSQQCGLCFMGDGFDSPAQPVKEDGKWTYI